ncbi:MAG: hypothetical protein Q8Q88_02380 [Phenylobacterium sp.]|uniref:hypothetical protein n=1 Tax=Phenylobacterium sp. TaxID=1871053 RepID=UPI0027367B9B|nr:hypothetical protein [Phenylobacterium sp.]MDP3745872.1 hypothetical protein [Phenylobacterium sp.]MDZ4390713.1 hypothetical protein [Gemmatimonadales bacterium]
MKAKKQMTIDDLAVVVQKGFQGVDHKFQDIESKMATKDMLENLATKDMLENLATKDMLDDLAMMTQKGFQYIESKMATKDMLAVVVESIDLVRQDVRDIKITLGPLVRTVASLDTDMQHLTVRVARLEQKGGLVKK